MLDKIPVEFFTSIKKVFEPCAGKGGFIVDIIDRFMIELKDSIPDEKERYKTIVEKCLYFSDINPTNIFICKLLIDPYNEYKLNYNEGNTDSYVSFHVKSYDEALSLLSYMETKYVNYLLSVRKISQDISENTCKWIPIVPLNKKWNNDEVYKYFEITEEEIKIIEESI